MICDPSLVQHETDQNLSDTVLAFFVEATIGVRGAFYLLIALKI